MWVVWVKGWGEQGHHLQAPSACLCSQGPTLNEAVAQPPNMYDSAAYLLVTSVR